MAFMFVGIGSVHGYTPVFLSSLIKGFAYRGKRIINLEKLKSWLYSAIRWAAIVIVVVFGSVVCIGSVSAVEKSLSSEQQTEIQELIRQYIIEHPAVIIDSLRKLEEQEERESAERARKNLIGMRNQLVKDPSSPVGGNPNGDVTIVEFFDYRCGYCKRVGPTILKILKTNPDVRYVFKELPILGPNSVTAARAALAAWRIDPAKYQEFHFKLMGSRGQLTELKVMDVADKSGLDIRALKVAMQAPDIQKTMEKNRQLANELKINGTPAFIVGDELVPGAVDFTSLQRLIKKARKS